MRSVILAALLAAASTPGLAAQPADAKTFQEKVKPFLDAH